VVRGEEEEEEVHGDEKSSSREEFDESPSGQGVSSVEPYS
jgi:hypothetical protein